MEAMSILHHMERQALCHQRLQPAANFLHIRPRVEGGDAEIAFDQMVNQSIVNGSGLRKAGTMSDLAFASFIHQFAAGALSKTKLLAFLPVISFIVIETVDYSCTHNGNLTRPLIDA